jgi:hypothetical protein
MCDTKFPRIVPQISVQNTLQTSGKPHRTYNNPRLGHRPGECIGPQKPDKFLEKSNILVIFTYLLTITRHRRRCPPQQPSAHASQRILACTRRYITMSVRVLQRSRDRKERGLFLRCEKMSQRASLFLQHIKAESTHGSVNRQRWNGGQIMVGCFLVWGYRQRAREVEKPSQQHARSISPGW